MYRIITLSIMLFFLSVAGCHKSAEAPEVIAYPDGAGLLGLERDHLLHYIVYDSLVQSYPVYKIEVDTSDWWIKLIRGQNHQVALSFNDSAQALMTVDDLGVLLSGQIRPAADPYDTIVFYPTPVLMPRTYSIGTTWSFSCPAYAGTEGEERFSLLYLNYGYLTTRKFIGKADVVLPSGFYEAYHFHSVLLPENNPRDSMVVDEFYADQIGPVKIESSAGGSRRLIILINDELLD